MAVGSIPSSAMIGPDDFFIFVILYAVGRTPCTGTGLSQGLYLHTGQHKENNANRYPCFEWDSDPWPQILVVAVLLPPQIFAQLPMPS
jgi:hypothetical protein